MRKAQAHEDAAFPGKGIPVVPSNLGGGRIADETQDGGAAPSGQKRAEKQRFFRETTDRVV